LLDVACRIRVGETLFRDDELVDEAAHALAAAQPAAEPVAWQFRWTNPGNQPDQNPEWEPIVPNWNQTMQEKITELEDYRYSGKPCYEVRVLVVGSKT
jgi:hypothetical protein